MPARVGYAICTTMRSGSTWLAELLGGTGVLGRPSEYFSTEIQRSLGHADYPDGIRAQVDHVLRHATTPNGVYAFKVYPLQVAEIAGTLRWTEAFPRLAFVHLRRRDLLGQAISRVRVRQTLQWRSTLPPRGEARYDGDAILEAMRRTLSQDARWQLFFARNGIEPLRLVYEDILSAPQATVDSVADLVGLDASPTAAPGDIPICVQRDAVSSLWRQRFLDEHADRDWMDIL